MKTFNDAAGRTWTIAMNLGTAMAVRDKLEIDLLQPEQGNPPLLTRIGTDEILLGQVVFALLEKQFKTQNVSEADVYAAFDGETIIAAQTAFYEELINFFQSRQRPDRAKAVQKQMNLIAAATKAAERTIEAIDINQAIDGAMSGALPDLSGLTPAPSPSANS